MPQIISQSEVASLWFLPVCWRGIITHKDARQLGKLLGGGDVHTEDVRGHSEQPPGSSTCNIFMDQEIIIIILFAGEWLGLRYIV